MSWNNVVRLSAPVVNQLRRESDKVQLPEDVVRLLLDVYGTATLNWVRAMPDSRAGFEIIRCAALDALGLHGDTLLGILTGAGLDPLVLEAFWRARARDTR